MNFLFYIVMGYLSGSILFGYLIPKYVSHVDVTLDTPDGNPGVSNAFCKAGVLIGILVLVLELSKGFFPVYLASRQLPVENPYFALVLLAPVLGHAFPFWRLQGGGKAIAVSFGVLLGLFSQPEALGFLMFFYLLFSLVVVINPHSLRSVVTYLCFSVCCFLLLTVKSIKLGAILISLVVIFRHLAQYHGEKLTMHIGPVLKRPSEYNPEIPKGKDLHL